MGRKKLILVIVEGSTDETALSGVLSKTMDANSFTFEYLKGNLFTDENVLKKEVKNILEEDIENYLAQKPQYREYIDCIIQITDTDGCFLAPNYIENGEDSIMYGIDKIVTPYRKKIIERHNVASQKIYEMANIGIFMDKPYFLLYLSREQEHVLHNEMKKLTTDEKTILAKQFRKSYKNHEIDFKKFISESPFTVTGNYQETWKFIRQGNNSLKRYSNLHLIYDITKELNEKEEDSSTQNDDKT